MKALENLASRQKTLQAGIDQQAATALSRSKGIFSMVNAARFQLDGSLKSKGVLWSYNTRDIKTYPIAVKAGGQLYALSHGASLGLDWDKISDSLQSAGYAIRAGDIRSGTQGAMYALASNCHILALPVSDSGQALDLYHSVGDIRENAMARLHIFRHALRSSAIKIDAGTNLNDAQKVLEFDRCMAALQTTSAHDRTSLRRHVSIHRHIGPSFGPHTFWKNSSDSKRIKNITQVTSEPLSSVENLY